MKFRNVFVLKNWIFSSSIVSLTWHMHKTRESRQRRLKTRPGSSPGSRQDDKMEPIWSRFDAWRGTSWIDCKKNAGSLKTTLATNDFTWTYVSIESQIEWRNLSDPEIYRRRSNVEFISYRLFISPPDIRLKIWSLTIWSSKFICFPVPNPIATKMLKFSIQCTQGYLK